MVPLFLILVSFLMLLMTIFQQLGPALPNEIPLNDNNNDLSYINNLNVDHYKFSFSSTSSSTVYKLCRSKATGLDSISAKIIRECADLISVSRSTQRQFSENICSEDDLRSTIFGTFAVKFLACLPLLRFSNISKMV